MAVINLSVSSGAGEYPVYIGNGLVDSLGKLLQKKELGPRIFAISNPLIWRLHGKTIQASIPDIEPILISSGERHKTLRTVSRIYEALLNLEADRASTIIAVGGGVIGDTAGFAAATYLRGLPLVQIPTTLLAQVDSSIGGKVGVNHPKAKNLIGDFYAPIFVSIDPDFLKTLPRRELRSGLYEVVKYGMIASSSILERLENHMSSHFSHDPAILIPTIEESCKIKSAIVSADERESNLRRVLNLGHTTGHALEALTKYQRFRHGEAVAYGLLVAASLAVNREVLAEADRDVLLNLIRQMGPLPPISDLSAKEALQVIRHDKKVLRGKLHFVLPTGLGHVEIVDNVSASELERAMKQTGMAD